MLEAAEHRRRRGGDRRIPARLPQLRGELHGQPAPAQGHPRHGARAARAEGRAAQDRQFPARRRRLSAVRPQRPDAQGNRAPRQGRRARPTTATSPSWRRSSGCSRNGCCARRPTSGARVSAIPKLLSLGRDMAGLSLAETRIVHDFAVRSAAEILDRHFKGDLDQGPVRIRRRGRQFRLAAIARAPPTSCSTICSAKRPACPAPGAMRSAAWARSPRRWRARAARRASTSSSTRRSRK